MTLVSFFCFFALLHHLWALGGGGSGALVPNGIWPATQVEWELSLQENQRQTGRQQAGSRQAALVSKQATRERL